MTPTEMRHHLARLGITIRELRLVLGVRDDRNVRRMAQGRHTISEGLADLLRTLSPDEARRRIETQRRAG